MVCYTWRSRYALLSCKFTCMIVGSASFGSSSSEVSPEYVKPWKVGKFFILLSSSISAVVLMHLYIRIQLCRKKYNLFLEEGKKCSWPSYTALLHSLTMSEFTSFFWIWKERVMDKILGMINTLLQWSNNSYLYWEMYFRCADMCWGKEVVANQRSSFLVQIASWFSW